MKAMLGWSAWWLLAAVALFGTAWLARYDVTATANSGGLITVTLDRWTGNEEACSLRECANVDRGRFQPEEPAQPAPTSDTGTVDFSKPGEFDTALNQASAHIEGDQQASSVLQSRIDNGIVGGGVAALLMIVVVAVRTVWRKGKGQPSS